MVTRQSRVGFRAQYHPPPLRPRVVHRANLVDRLLASQDTRLVTITAPAGYGKTTLMTLWQQVEPRPTAWLTVDRHHNEPALLVTDIWLALSDAKIPIPIPRVPRTSGSASFDTVVAADVGRLVESLESCGASGVLVLDQVERIRAKASRDVVAELAARLPPAVQMVVASRSSVRLPIALLRAQGSLLELTASDLAMSESEARTLLANVDVIDSSDVDEILQHAEGWPAALFLVALAVKSGVPLQEGLPIGGDDRFVADYLREELLGHVSDARATFMLRTSVLERVSAPLCNAVNGTDDSDRTIDRLEKSNLVIPLDHTREWYRYHRLLREFLYAELVRREPESLPDLHLKAATWYDANGMPEAAIRHAQAADDDDLVARIVARVARRTYALGEAETAFAWLRWFEQTGRIKNHPEIAALGAWACVLTGDEIGTARWTDGLFTDHQLSPSAYFLRAVLMPQGIEQMRSDIYVARKATTPDSEWLAVALVLEGMAELWSGNTEHADSSLARSASVASRLVALPAMTLALGGLALLALNRSDVEDAAGYAAQAQDQIREYGLEQYITSGLTFAVAAQCATRAGRIDDARFLLARTQPIRPLLTVAAPGIALQTLNEVARAYLALSDVAGARTVLRQSSGILAERPDLGTLTSEHKAIRAKVDTMAGGMVGVSALTTAELRLLPLLVTHLSFPAIGDRLSISRHTVKTHALSIYRKLGASSRSEAVGLAAEAGLLPPETYVSAAAVRDKHSASVSVLYRHRFV